MADVKAVLVDENFFQVYDNKDQFTEKYVASGLYWNYFYHVWKTVSTSDFSNAVVFVLDSATLTAPESLEFIVTNTDTSDEAWTVSFKYNDTDTLAAVSYTHLDVYKRQRLSGSVAKSEPRRAYKKEIQLIFFVSKHIIPHQPQKVKRGEQIWKDYYISVLYS